MRCCSALQDSPQQRTAWPSMSRPIGLAPGRSQEHPTPALSPALKVASHPSFTILGDARGSIGSHASCKTDPLEEGTRTQLSVPNLA